MSEWIESIKELPPDDGSYEVTNNPVTCFDLGILKYDGYGFSDAGIYKSPRFWRSTKPKEKIYGKLEIK